MSKKELVNQLEDVIYSSEDKSNSDLLFTQYVELISLLDFTNMKVKVNTYPIGLVVRHKAFSIKLLITITDNNVFVNGEPMEPDLINNYIAEKIILKK